MARPAKRDEVEVPTPDEDGGDDGTDVEVEAPQRADAAPGNGTPPKLRRTLSDLWRKWPLGTDPSLEVQITRISPKQWRGVQCSGLLRTLRDFNEENPFRPFTEDDLAQMVGGGQLRVAIHGPAVDGTGNRVKDQVFVTIAVATCPPKLVDSNGHSTAPPLSMGGGGGGGGGGGFRGMTQMQAPTGADRMIERVWDTMSERDREARQAMKETFAARLDAEKAKMTPAAIAPGPSPDVVALQIQLAQLQAQLQAQGGRSAEANSLTTLTKDVVATSAQNVTTLQEAHRAELASVRTACDQRISDADRRISDMRSQYDTDVRNLRDRFESELTRLRDRFEDADKRRQEQSESRLEKVEERTERSLSEARAEAERREQALRTEHQREVELLKSQHSGEKQTLENIHKTDLTGRALLVESTKESLNREILRLQSELSDAKSEIEGLRDKQPPTDLKGKLAELAEFKGVVKSITGGDSDEEKSAIRSIGERLIDKAAEPLVGALATRIAGGMLGAAPAASATSQIPQRVPARRAPVVLRRPSAPRPTSILPPGVTPEAIARAGSSVPVDVPAEAVSAEAVPTAPATQVDAEAMAMLAGYAEQAVRTGQKPEEFAGMILQSVAKEQVAAMLAPGLDPLMASIETAAKATGQRALLSVSGRSFLKKTFAALQGAV